MKNLYFVRHGQTQSNVDDVWGGQNETPLTPKGIEQAKNAGISAMNQGLKFDLIISSPLSRAINTAQLLAKELNYPENLIMIDALLIERTFGILDGKPDATSFFDNHVYKDIDNIDNSEKVEDLQKRAAVMLQKIKALPETNILLVSHGAFGRALRREVNRQPYTDEFTNDWNSMFIPNAEIIKLI